MTSIWKTISRSARRIDALLPDFGIIYATYWAAIALLAGASLVMYFPHHTSWSIMAAGAFIAVGTFEVALHMRDPERREKKAEDTKPATFNALCSLHVIYSSLLSMMGRGELPGGMQTLALIGGIFSVVLAYYVRAKGARSF